MILEYFWSQPTDIGESNIRLVVSGLFSGQFCRLEEVRILNGLIKNMIVLYLQIFITNNIFVSKS